jgi:hypothetical protein
MVSHLESAVDGEVGSHAAPIGTSVSYEPRGFSISGRVFPVEGLGGLSTLGDSLFSEMLFVGEAEGISWGTLHGSSRISNEW